MPFRTTLVPSLCGGRPKQIQTMPLALTGARRVGRPARPSRGGTSPGKPQAIVFMFAEAHLNRNRDAWPFRRKMPESQLRMAPAIAPQRPFASLSLPDGPALESAATRKERRTCLQNERLKPSRGRACPKHGMWNDWNGARTWPCVFRSKDGLCRIPSDGDNAEPPAVRARRPRGVPRSTASRSTPDRLAPDTQRL